MLRCPLLLSFLILFSAGPAVAGSTTQTDDNGTAGDKHWEFTIAYTPAGYDQLREIRWA
jgi:hypothetical protein